jgi:hypothetical protein
LKTRAFRDCDERSLFFDHAACSLQLALKLRDDVARFSQFDHE